MQTLYRKIITYENSNSAVAEAYKTLRTKIQWSVQEDNLKSILVTATDHQSGKSYTAVNMAVSFAQLGKKVVVVDSDLRNPVLHEFFNKSNRNGLSQLLSGQIQVEQCLTETSIENVTLLPSGGIPQNPSELLESSRMNDLLEYLKQNFEVIILDSPPIQNYSDANIVAKKSDGVVFVVRSGKTKKEVAEKALQQMIYLKANILGVVLNDHR